MIAKTVLVGAKPGLTPRIGYGMLAGR